MVGDYLAMEAFTASVSNLILPLLTPKNALVVYLVTISANLSSLQKACVDFITKNFAEVRKQEGFSEFFKSDEFEKLERMVMDHESKSKVEVQIHKLLHRENRDGAKDE